MSGLRQDNRGSSGMPFVTVLHAPDPMSMGFAQHQPMVAMMPSSMPPMQANPLSQILMAVSQLGEPVSVTQSFGSDPFMMPRNGFGAGGSPMKIKMKQITTRISRDSNGDLVKQVNVVEGVSPDGGEEVFYSSPRTSRILSSTPKRRSSGPIIEEIDDDTPTDGKYRTPSQFFSPSNRGYYSRREEPSQVDVPAISYSPSLLPNLSQYKSTYDDLPSSGSIYGSHGEQTSQEQGTADLDSTDDLPSNPPPFTRQDADVWPSSDALDPQTFNIYGGVARNS